MADEIVVEAAAPAAPAAAPAAPAAAPAAPASGTAPAAKPAAAAPAPAPEVVVEQPEVKGASPLLLDMPAFLPLSERTPEREAMVTEFAQVAADAGIESKHPGLSQDFIDQVVEVASGLGHYDVADQYTTPEDTCSQMERMFGRESAEKIVVDAQKTVRALGPKTAAYLDRTGLGNDVAVLVALAQGGYLTRTKEAAHEELAKTMQTKEYQRGDKLLVLKVHALSRIANREAMESEPVAKPEMVRVGIGRVVTSDHQQVELRAEAAALAGKRGGMSVADRERFMAITRTLSGGA